MRPQSSPVVGEAQGPSGAGREAHERVHSAALVTEAMDEGTWPTDVETIDAVVALLESASRWALVCELGTA